MLRAPDWYIKCNLFNSRDTDYPSPRQLWLIYHFLLWEFFFTYNPLIRKNNLSEVKTEEGYISRDICPHNVRTTSHEGYICLFKVATHTCSQSYCKKPERRKEGLWSTGRSGWRKPQGNVALATPGHCLASRPVAWLHVCVATFKKTDISREMFGGHSADISALVACKL